MSDNIESDVLPTAFIEFATALVNNLRLRFPDTGIYNAMKIFDFSQIIKFQQSKMKWQYIVNMKSKY